MTPPAPALSLAKVRRVAKALGCVVTYTYFREDRFHDISVDAPAGKRFRASDCHFIGGGSWYGTQADGAEEFAAIFPIGGAWNSGPLRGWAYTARVGERFVNTHATPLPTEKDAKDAAMKLVKEWMAARVSP